ncbi:MAG: AAA family ATPase, partial [Actinomycetota bacterium]|nr:AAA family ATPase [Actinomycetota bacterium]
MTLVTASTAAHLPAASDLIGRQYELAELTAALEDLRSGRGRLFLLTGDAGIGKTRLLEAVADVTAPTDTTVLWGRCWEGGGAAPYWPWSQVVGTVLRDLDGHRSSAYPEAVLRYVSELAAERAVVADRPRASSGIDLPGARAALFDAIVTLLRIRSAEGGLVVALDDLQAADEASLRLLQFVARELSSSPVLIVATYRDADVRSSPSLHQLMSAISRQGRRITLSGLDEDGVALLLRRITGGTRLVADARTIHDTTDGNPFFVQETARLLVAEHHLARDTAATGRVPVPEEVHLLIRRRLDPLPAEAHEALRMASVLGRDFEVGVLATLSDQSPDALLDVLDQGAELAVVEDRGLGRWQFCHALLREAL